MASIPKPFVSPSEYLLMERAATTKSDFFCGELFQMAGASFAHNLIVSNFTRELGVLLAQSTCKILASDMRVAIDEQRHYVYPDVVVVCDTPQFLDSEFDTLINPSMIVEVLSDSTQAYDLTTKFDGYRTMPSVQTIVFVRQDRAMIMVYERSTSTVWNMTAVSSISIDLNIAFRSLRIRMADIYRQVSF